MSTLKIARTPKTLAIPLDPELAGLGEAPTPTGRPDPRGAPGYAPADSRAARPRGRQRRTVIAAIYARKSTDPHRRTSRMQALEL